MNKLFFLKKKNLEDMSPFCGATDTPVFGLLVMSPLGLKARVGSALFGLGRGIHVTHSLTSDTCRADLFHIPAKALVGLEWETSLSISECSTD